MGNRTRRRGRPVRENEQGREGGGERGRGTLPVQNREERERGNERARERGCENSSNQRPLTNIYLQRERERERESQQEREQERRKSLFEIE